MEKTFQRFGFWLLFIAVIHTSYYSQCSRKTKFELKFDFIISSQNGINKMFATLLSISVNQLILKFE